MLFKNKKKNLIILLIIFILFITGCSDSEIENNNEDASIDCGYNYTYGCGFDAISGSTKCGYGYYYTCRA